MSQSMSIYSLITKIKQMKHFVKNLITKLVLSNKRKENRRLKAEKQRLKQDLPHTFIVYIAINDPLSYLLLQILPEIQQRFQITLDFNPVLQKNATMFPEMARWNENVLKDAIRLANLYQLQVPATYAAASMNNEQLSQDYSLQLVKFSQQDNFIEQALPLFQDYWQPTVQNNNAVKQYKTDGQNRTDLAKILSKNEQALQNNGHYLSATIFYGGEWYWGLERLHHLEQRLNQLLLPTNPKIQYDKLHQPLQPYNQTTRTSKTVLKCYLSVRSPYSYLGLKRAIELAEYYQIPLELKPVLPMLMRNLPVPKQKSLYIITDVKREADFFGIDFGNIADPLGEGVKRCYALFNYAKTQGKGNQFMLNFMQGVWAKGIRSETDKGMRKIIEKTGLNWQQAKKHLHDQQWHTWAEDNLASLYDMGLWGVPSFKYQDTCVFGQDKLYFIEQAIISGEL